MRVKLLLLVACIFVLFPLALVAQTTQAPQAASAGTSPLVIAQQARAALYGAVPLADVTMTGTATRTIGPDSETGNFTLKALGDNQSRFDFTFASGTTTEVYNVSSATNAPQGFWIGTDSAVHSIANHNCFAGEVWFFPALTIVGDLSNPAVSVSYVGAETKNGVAVTHLSYTVAVPGVSSVPDPILTPLSATEVYLDSNTLLPVAITYYVHPDNDLLLNIPVEVDFSSYKPVQGVQTPFHVQKFFNGNLLFDLSVQSVNMNTGLTTAAFSVD